MGTFAYLARGENGEEVNGLLQGRSIDEVIGELHQQGLAVLHVAEDRGQQRAQSWRAKLGAIPFGGVSNRDLALFSRQLSTVLESGIPLVRGLRGLAADTTSRVLAAAVSDVALRIERGETLSEAMSAHPRAFNGMYVSMVRAGERAGTLDRIVEQLAVYMEKVDEIETKVRAALSYPVFVLVFAILASLFLLLKIVPTFAEIYADLGQDLPTVTRVVVDASNAVRNNALVSLALAFAFVIGLTLATRSRTGRYAIDVFKLNVPLFGPIVRKAVMSRFARTFGILLQSGLPVLQGLDLVRGASGNEVVSRAIDDAKTQIAAGRPITESFRATGKFPEMTLQLMATGEEAGNLDTMLIKSSDFYDRQVDAAVHSISSLIEPLMIVIVGALIGIIVVAMFLPIFYLGDAIMQGGYNY
jgi:type IV pilus assembly protein PilC